MGIAQQLGCATELGLQGHPITRATHRELHALLRAELRKAGIPLNIGGRGGSARAWVEYFRSNPGSQQKALDALVRVSK